MQSKQNKDLLQRCETNTELQNKQKQTSQKFKQFQQLALYSQPSIFSKKMFVSIKREEEEMWACKESERINLQIIVGLGQPDGEKSIEKIMLNIVSFVPRPSSNYSVIYINTLANSSAYSDFKKILEFLPIEYLYFLDKIYVLQANFKNKASYWISFDYLTNYIKTKTVHLSTFKELTEKIDFNSEKLLDLLPQEITSCLGKKEQAVRKYLDRKKPKESIIYNTNIFNIEEDTYIQKRKAENMMKNVSHSVLKSTYKHKDNDIDSYEVGQTGAPLIIELLISYFNGKEELLDTQGLFRKSVSIDDQTQLTAQLSSRNYDCLESIQNPHLIANAIKRFLSNLDEPLIPFEEFELLMEVGQAEYKAEFVRVVGTLKNNRRMTLLLLVDFLKEKLLPRGDCNKMNESNLSIVFGPCLMRSKVPSAKDLILTKKAIGVTLLIFKQFAEIFGNSKERTMIIRKSVYEQQRESLKFRLGNFQATHKQLQSTLPNEKQIGSKEQQSSEAITTSNILKDICLLMQAEMKQSQKLQEQQFYQPLLLEQPQQVAKTIPKA